MSISNKKYLEAVRALMRPIIANIENREKRDWAIKELAEFEKKFPTKEKRDA